MKLVRLALPALAIGFVFGSCDQSVPTDSEAASPVETIVTTADVEGLFAEGICPLSNAWLLVSSYGNEGKDKNGDGLVCTTTNPSGNDTVIDNNMLGGSLDELSVSDLSQAAAVGVARACMTELADFTLDNPNFIVDTIQECRLVCDFSDRDVCDQNLCEEACVRGFVDGF